MPVVMRLNSIGIPTRVPRLRLKMSEKDRLSPGARGILAESGRRGTMPVIGFVLNAPVSIASVIPSFVAIFRIVAVEKILLTPSSSFRNPVSCRAPKVS